MFWKIKSPYEYIYITYSREHESRYLTELSSKFSKVVVYMEVKEKRKIPLYIYIKKKRIFFTSLVAVIRCTINSTKGQKLLHTGKNEK